MNPTDPAPSMSIGELAARFGLQTHVLRHWESMGLLNPRREIAGRRRYGADDLYRLVAIMRAKEAGFGLAAIAEMLTSDDPALRQAHLVRHRDELVEKITRAQAALAMIEGALRCDHDDLLTCPHFQATVSATISSTEPLTSGRP